MKLELSLLLQNSLYYVFYAFIFQLLDEVSGIFGNPQNPKLAPIAKKIYNEYGREITDVFSLKTDDDIWVSFGENYISPFSKSLVKY